MIKNHRNIIDSTLPREHFRPISYRLTLYVGIFSIFITLTIVCISLARNYYQDLNNTHAHINQLKETVTPPLAQAMWEFNQNHINALLSGLMQSDDVIHVRLSINNDVGDQLIEYGRKKPSQIFHQVEHQSAILHQDSHIELGILTLTTSSQSTFLRIQQSAGQILLTVGLLIFLVAFFIVWIVNRLLTRHLQDISRFTEQLSLNNLNTPLQLQRKRRKHKYQDELDIVSTSINKMRLHLLDDIEQRHQVETELNQEKQERFKMTQRQKATVAASKAKDEFLAAMSHEIRTPMNGVMGMLDLLADTKLNQDQEYFVNMALTSSESLRFIIDDILDYSKLDAGKMTLEIIPFNLNTLITECLQSLYISAYNKQLMLYADTALDLPETFMGDPNRLRQIIINLLGNAVKFTERGYVSINIKHQLNISSPDQCLVEISINDSGIGISQEQQQMLFSPFTQADQSTSRKFGGSGLGLAISKRLIDLMHGEINLSSSVNQGSQFKLTLNLGVYPQDKSLETQQPVVSLNESHKKHLALLINTNPDINAFLHKTIKLSHRFCDEITDLHAAITKTQHSHLHYDDIIINYDRHNISDVETLPTLLRSLASDIRIHLICHPADALDRKLYYPLKLIQHYHPLSSQQLYQQLQAGEDVISADTDNKNSNIDCSFLSVLVVDDNEINLMVAKGFLQKLSIQAQLVNSGEEALRLVESNQNYDLIFMDCEMPGMDGFITTKKIRSFEHRCQKSPSYIVALTANVLQQHKDQASASGMNDFLPKPLKSTSLQQCIEDFLHKTQIHNNRSQH